MQIWVDADACPNVIKDILFRAAERTKTPLILVANQTIGAPKSAYVKTLRVERGFDIADNEIVKRLNPGDLVITSDIPLAADALRKGAHALSPRGERYDIATIGARLNMRDFLETMRSSGIHTGGPAALTQSERRDFANHLNSLLSFNR